MIIDVKFTETIANINVDFGEFQVIHISDSEIYGGPYVVSPKGSSSQILQTKNKLMTDDVTVNKIRSFEEINSSGYTFVIGD